MTQESQQNLTSCYTYEVVMVVQVLASSKADADIKLEKEGGYVSKRDVSFKDVVALYSGKKEEMKEE